MTLYAEKEQKYFSNARLDLISLIPQKAHNKVLEIGAGGGDTLVQLKQMGIADEVVGVELFDLPGTNQQHASIDKFIKGDIEKMDLSLPKEHFDVIICGDVLEHLADPWALIKKGTSHLKKGGVWIVSIPNIREFHALFRIAVKGDFGYEKSGIFDKTHLKFFCKKNIMDLMSTNNLEIVKVYSDLDFAPKRKKTLFNKATFRVLDEFLSTQYMVVSKKIA